jgi:hypothetical protein
VNAPGLVKPAPSLPFTAFLPLQLPNLGLWPLPEIRLLAAFQSWGLRQLRHDPA